MTSKPRNIVRGSCSFCGATVEDQHVIIRYRTGTGEPGCWAECPSCVDVIDPTFNDQ